MAYEGCWYSELEQEANNHMINLEKVKISKKSQWKKTIIAKIKELVERIKGENTKHENIKTPEM